MKKVLHINLHIPVIYPNLSGWAWALFLIVFGSSGGISGSYMGGGF